MVTLFFDVTMVVRKSFLLLEKVLDHKDHLEILVHRDLKETLGPQGPAGSGGGGNPEVHIVNADYTTDVDWSVPQLILMDASGGDKTVTLATPIAGATCMIIKDDGLLHSVTIQATRIGGSGIGTVNRASNMALTEPREAVLLVCQGMGGDWNVISLDNPFGSLFTEEFVTVISELPRNVSAHYPGTFLVDASGGAGELILSAGRKQGVKINVKKIDSSANAVTVSTMDTETIDGVDTKVLPTQNASLTVVCDGTNWWSI
jgi:hypothetical protein